MAEKKMSQAHPVMCHILSISDVNLNGFHHSRQGGGEMAAAPLLSTAGSLSGAALENGLFHARQGLGETSPGAASVGARVPCQALRWRMAFSMRDKA